MQISAANASAAFQSRASKFLVTNRTLSYSAQVSGTRNLGGELGSCAMGLRLSVVTMSLSEAVSPNLQRKVSASTMFVKKVSCLFTETESSAICNIE